MDLLGLGFKASILAAARLQVKALRRMFHVKQRLRVGGLGSRWGQ
jgi:hypothetical protein